MKVVCKNLVCKGRAFTINQRQAQQLDRIVCPHCGHQGAMPKGETLTGDEVVAQIDRWQDQVLYKKVFKHLNTKKLPDTMAKQQQRQKRQTPAPKERSAVKQPVHNLKDQPRHTRIRPRRR